ncbi:MAG: winged helix-turn-helix domain-containing protein [Candidatus Nanohaloarchaea archaeon]|nr:winged helix-turn-helix domain-containing protein [Candidatus Nanohaloarchaea archaeon]
MFDYLVAKDEFLPVQQLDTGGIEALANPDRRNILKICRKRSMTVEDIADEIGKDRQTTYYHIQQLEAAELLEKDGGHPSYYTASDTAYYYRPEDLSPLDNPVMLSDVPPILEGFIRERRVRTKIVVGAPYPHGQHGRRHQTAYKAGEIACTLGNYGKKSTQLIYTDEDVAKRDELRNNPLISVAGFRVNTLSAELNDAMPARFDPSGDTILTEDGGTFSGGETGLIARTEIDGRRRMLVAGISGLGTSAAIRALEHRPEELGDTGAVVQGYGTKEEIEDVSLLTEL